MDYVVKNTKNNGILLVKNIDKQIAKQLLIKNHYSKTWNFSFGKINYGIFRDDMLLGVASFGSMMNPKSHKSLVDTGQESIIELNRLWVDDKLVRNAETVFISSCFKMIKANAKNIKFVQSFADGRLGCGTIYKASNFKYYGYHKTKFLRNIDTGVTVHKLRYENTKRLSGMLALCREYLDSMLECIEVKTYRYIYPLYKNIKPLLKEISYPEYEKGEIITSPDIFSKNHIARLSLFYENIGDMEYAKKAFDLGYRLFPETFGDTICEQTLKIGLSTSLEENNNES